jgi:Tfp pilus assembly protein PilF
MMPCPTARRPLAIVALCATLAVLGCGQKGPESNSGQPPQQRSQELIDAGNQAFRTGNFALAARRYAAAAVVKPDDPAAYYGMGMALTKLGKDEEARRAYAKARELAQAQQQQQQQQRITVPAASPGTP